MIIPEEELISSGWKNCDSTPHIWENKKYTFHDHLATYIEYKNSKSYVFILDKKLKKVVGTCLITSVKEAGLFFQCFPIFPEVISGSTKSDKEIFEYNGWEKIHNGRYGKFLENRRIWLFCDPSYPDYFISNNYNLVVETEKETLLKLQGNRTVIFDCFKLIKEEKLLNGRDL